jgi:excisionase family DNA binding protein
MTSIGKPARNQSGSSNTQTAELPVAERHTARSDFERQSQADVESAHSRGTRGTELEASGLIDERGALSANLPLTVKAAARFLGVSPQTVYLWVERKQIPHLRVMGRNIRFLRSDLEPFRAQFKQEVGNGKTA